MTTLIIIPKMEHPSSLRDYRPIACCTVIYKVISKVLAGRLGNILGRIINLNQSAFVIGRKIIDNVLIAHEIIRNYHRENGPPTCALKVDLRKAYDFVCWDFIEEVLLGSNFPSRFINWMMECIRTPWYFVLVNGSVEGFFPRKKRFKTRGILYHLSCL